MGLVTGWACRTFMSLPYNHSAMYAMAIWELSQALVTERSDEYSR